MILTAVLALALVMGVLLGMLGGGGSILTVPILVYVAGLDAKQAIAASLFVVGVTSAAGVVMHARARRIRWRTGLLFGVSGMVGGFVAGIVGGRLPGGFLLGSFAVVMVATSAAMLRGRRTDAEPGRDDLRVVPALGYGLVVGLVTGFAGAGGGFLMVPALTLLGGLSMSAAIGTSLLVIAMKSFAGLAGYLTMISVPWGLVLGVTVVAVIGSVAGGRMSGLIAEERLRIGFGWFVLLTGIAMLLAQVGVPLPALAGVVVAVLACALRSLRRPLPAPIRPLRPQL